MEIQTREVEEGTEINVRTNDEIAVVVNTDEERIYLPEARGSDSTYYVEEVESLVETEDGYKVVHTEEVDRSSIEVLG
ncbi:MAG: hypothetical protein H8Z69_01845 [Nanohaloarchaea archaeon]|nr:hypothetical protein [Candidatus Nanohaloarchaea archaeon]